MLVIALGRALASDEMLGRGAARRPPLQLVCMQTRAHVKAAIAQLVARRSHNPKVVSSILTRRI